MSDSVLEDFLNSIATRPLRLLDLGADSTWLIRHGASSALTTRPAAHYQTWAHHIAAALGDEVDGLDVPSVRTGTNVVLFGRAADSIPRAPEERIALGDPALFPALQMLADQIGYRLIRANARRPRRREPRP